MTRSIQLWVLTLPCISLRATPALNDWCINLKGDSTSACNGSVSLPQNVDSTAFDFKLNKTPCCDVFWALRITGLKVPTGSQTLLLFAVTAHAPASGFYLQQTNRVDGESIYHTESLTLAPVPLPNPMALLASTLVLLALVYGSKDKIRRIPVLAPPRP
jgi:hypothetical protein